MFQHFNDMKLFFFVAGDRDDNLL